VRKEIRTYFIGGGGKFAYRPRHDQGLAPSVGLFKRGGLMFVEVEEVGSVPARSFRGEGKSCGFTMPCKGNQV